LPAVTARRRHRGRGLLILLIVVAVLLVAADRIAVVVAERKVASRVQSSQNLATAPSVTIEGFPFLTQVVANHYPKVKLAARGLTVGDSGKRVTVGSLTAQLGGVRAIGNYTGVTAQSVSGAATIGYSELSRLVGLDLSYAGATSDGNGRVQANASVTALGQTVRGTVAAELKVSTAQVLSFSQVQVAISGGVGVSVPQSITSQFQSLLAGQYSLAGLPFGLRIQRLQAGPSGVTIFATAHDVSLG